MNTATLMPMASQQKRLIGHGAVVFAISLLAGFGLLFTLIGGLEVFPGTIISFEFPGDTRGWARAHTGGALNGLLMFGAALVIWAVQVPKGPATALHWMVLGAGYANTLFYWGSLFSPNRGLSVGGNRLGESNFFGVIAYLPAVVFGCALVVAMIILARQAFALARQ